MRTLVVLFAVLAVSAAAPKNPQRIVGGSLTSVSEYPSITALLYASNQQSFSQYCGGTILNNRAILSAAHCFHGDIPGQWRCRAGSNYGNSGGQVHQAQSLIIHAAYNTATVDNDIAIMRTATALTYTNNAVQPGLVAGSNYNLGDNQVVWAAGWGSTSWGGWASEQLRHVQIWTVNQATCNSRYGEIGLSITDNMLCSGWLDVGGRDQCQGDSGGPLYHNGVVVGVCSWGYQCALARYPGVNARVSRYTAWIQANA